MDLKPLQDFPDLSERAYRRIKDAIITLKFRPGEILNIGDLAKQLNISRTPVREALLRLELDHLVTVLPQKGREVAGICAEDITEIFELRIVLESYAIKVVTARLTDVDLFYIEDAMLTATQAFRRRENNIASDSARELHNIIIKKVNNSRMQAVLETLEDHYIRIRNFSSLIPGRLQKSLAQHEVIIDALKTRDPQKAEYAMIDHLTSVKEDILASIENPNEILEMEINLA